MAIGASPADAQTVSGAVTEHWVMFAHTMLPELFPSGHPIDTYLGELTARERQVAYLIGCAELNTRDTAAVLGVSEVTVRVLRGRIRHKLQPGVNRA